MPKTNPTLSAIAALGAEQQKLIRAAAEADALPSSSAIERIARLEDEIFGLEHVVDSHKAT